MRDLLADELATSRGRSGPELGVRRWGEHTRLDGEGLGLDSLERLNASAALNEFFHLHEYGAEDYLLSLPTLGEWCDLVEQSHTATGTHLTFRTSGSTGTPKRCTHAISDLMVEVEGWAELVSSADTILSLVPAHHIYGTIFTALLPDHLGMECISGRFALTETVARGRGRALAIGTPTLWGYLERSLPRIPQCLRGVSSTGPMPADLAYALKQKGLATLLEVYGSSETGGVAYRFDPDQPYTMLSQWRRKNDSTLVRTTTNGCVAEQKLMDEAEWLSDRSFALGQRRDGAVQIGGHNVFPDRVRQHLLQHEGIAEAMVRMDASSGRLKAFVVLRGSHGKELSVEQLDAWCAQRLRDHERPRRFTIGATLPKSAIGKLTDW